MLVDDMPPPANSSMTTVRSMVSYMEEAGHNLLPLGRCWVQKTVLKFYKQFLLIHANQQALAARLESE
jgi:hypothetical protein